MAYDYLSGGRVESVEEAELEDLQKVLVTGGLGSTTSNSGDVFLR